MSKGAAEKKDGHAAKPEGAAGGVEHKKSGEPPVKAGKGHTPLPGGCHSWSCKSNATRFNFCDEHFDQFKFGLIKKTGEPVPDYEKKFEHYHAFKAKRDAHKVA